MCPQDEHATVRPDGGAFWAVIIGLLGCGRPVAASVDICIKGHRDQALGQYAAVPFGYDVKQVGSKHPCGLSHLVTTYIMHK
jgi:hypothetical protein